jgi:hypothetical protein
MTTTTPRWQIITGITPDNEADMPCAEYIDRMRKLIKEVERLADDEFCRAADDKDSQRTVFWDPIDFICNHLEISRVHLSRITLELTGLRAHEITDRLKGRVLPLVVKMWVDKKFSGMQEALNRIFPPEEAAKPEALHRCVKMVTRALREERSGNFATSWACELGFANPSRAKNACKHAHQVSIGELEERHVRTLVQKFLEPQIAAASALPETTKTQSHEDSKKEEKQQQPAAQPIDRLKALQKEMGLEENLSPEDEAALNQILKELVA